MSSVTEGLLERWKMAHSAASTGVCSAGSLRNTAKSGTMLESPVSPAQAANYLWQCYTER